MNGLILILTDETRELKKLREVLSQEGYDIMTAANIEIAEQICEKIPVDLVLAKKSMINFKTNNKIKSK